MPADFTTLVKAPTEKSKEFNERLRVACESVPVTSFEATVVDGQPVITLMSELDYPTEDMIEEAKEAGEKLDPDEMVPVGAPICVQVAGLSAVGEDVAMSEKAMSALNHRAKGECDEVRYFSGQFVQWVPDHNDVINQVPKPKFVLAQVPVVFAAVAYLTDAVPAEAQKTP